MTTSNAGVSSFVQLKSKDETGALRTTGGDIYYLHLLDRCYLDNNFYCTESPDATNILQPPIMKLMTDNGNGTYTTTYSSKYDGLATLDILVLYQGGWYAEYFNNAFLDGVPAIKRTDNLINFDWGTGLVTADAADFVSARWFGKVKAIATEEVTFILHADDGVRLYLNGALLIDRWDTCCEDVTGTSTVI